MFMARVDVLCGNWQMKVALCINFGFGWWQQYLLGFCSYQPVVGSARWVLWYLCSDRLDWSSDGLLSTISLLHVVPG